MGSVSMGSLSRRGLCVQGNLCAGGLCQGRGSLSTEGVSVHGGGLCLRRGSLSRGLCQGISVRTPLYMVKTGWYASYLNAFLLFNFCALHSASWVQVLKFFLGENMISSVISLNYNEMY